VSTDVAAAAADVYDVEEEKDDEEDIKAENSPAMVALSSD
jgi:hypothetical protein